MRSFSPKSSLGWSLLFIFFCSCSREESLVVHFDKSHPSSLLEIALSEKLQDQFSFFGEAFLKKNKLHISDLQLDHEWSHFTQNSSGCLVPIGSVATLSGRWELLQNGSRLQGNRLSVSIRYDFADSSSLLDLRFQDQPTLSYSLGQLNSQEDAEQIANDLLTTKWAEKLVYEISEWLQTPSP